MPLPLLGGLVFPWFGVLFLFSISTDGDVKVIHLP